MTTASMPLADRTTGRVVLPHISWDTYTSLLGEIGDSPIRLTYDRGLLEIEVPSLQHERLKTFLGQLVETCLMEAGINFEPAGSATWKRQEDLQGLEADECYYVQHAALVKDKSEIDLSIDPAPDLAIEVDLTSSSLDKIAIYGSIGVPEVWRLAADGDVQMLARQPDGAYLRIDCSLCLPRLTPDVVRRAVALRQQVGHSEALRQMKEQMKRSPT